jgi:hypothetical protein
VTTVDPRLKYQLAVVYNTPNECVGCRKTDNGNLAEPSANGPALTPGMVDLQADIDWYGSVYICSDCALQVARIFGAISPAEYEGMERDLTNALADLSKLRQENLGLKKVVDGYRDYGQLVTGDFAASLVTSVEEPAVSIDDVSGTEDVSGDEEPEEDTETSDTLTGSERSGVSEESDSGEGSGSSEVIQSTDQQESGDLRSDTGDKLAAALGL